MSDALKKNSILTVTVVDITDLGFGVAKHGGKVIFIQDTVPGDVAEIQIIKVNASYMIARLNRLLVPSEKRVNNRCCEDKCRACAYKCLSYDSEAELKKEGVRRLFAPLGITTRPILKSVDEKRYRNKAQYPIAMIDGSYEVGYYAPKTHRVSPITDCELTPKFFGDIINICKLYFTKYNLSVYDEESGEGLLRHVYLRRGEVTGEMLVCLVINGEDIPEARELTSALTEAHPEIVGVLLNINRENTNVVLGERYVTLYGRDYIFDTLAGVRLKITAASFYQVNRNTAELLYREAMRLADPQKSDTLLDLYCGAGSIGLSMAHAVGELVGIEIVESAVLCARENALANGIENAHFFVGDAKNTEELLANAERELGKKIKPDIIVLDPPRGGLDPELIKFSSSLNPRKIVYISCNPKTLARDVKIFFELGYFTNEVLPVDMFALTGHVESVVCLTRQSDVI